MELKVYPASRYGCVKCQAHHYMGDELFDEHILFQSKHGIEQISYKRWLEETKLRDESNAYDNASQEEK